MFFSLAQTLVCVLLINGGLYALHLSGNGEKPATGSGSSAASAVSAASGASSTSGVGVGSGSASSGWQQHQQHQQQLQQQQQLQLHQHAGGGAPPGGGHGHRSAAAAAFDATTGRLNKEIADMAQLERERLMLLGLAKQTAESPGGGSAPAGHHGRPIIAGRIQMQPSEDLDVGDYPALLQQAARGFMFGRVEKQPPPPMAADEDYEQLREFGRRPVKYDYGRVVQPTDRELEAETLYEPLHGFGDFDDFSELEPSVGEEQHVGGEDELLRELDAYQYHGLEEEPLALPENPYRTLEQLELSAPETLQQLLEQEQQQQQQQQRDAPAKSSGKAHNAENYNIRMQQKWARKRAQSQSQLQLQHAQQPALQRNIFGQHFKQQRGKLALANSEATASKHFKAATRSGGGSSSNSNSNSNLNSGKINEQSESVAAAANQQQNKTELESSKQQQQEQQNKKDTDPQLMHPNHKRSGSGSAGGSHGGYASPPATHSIASQLMLRSARGQRQYDVPQIECPTAMDGMERFACPTPDLQGRYRCIDDHVLCDGFIDCPEGEDEDRRSCMFYKTTKAHLDVLADALLRWARGR
ncbi:hypothetical protein KR222_001601 [Zaprionus bogoriensis]|nr:hypothetical protein KR222_001601 [Zaprionus bogoriensis]